MVTWIHLLCGKRAEFGKDDNPNKEPQPPCPNCGIAVGGWRRG